MAVDISGRNFVVEHFDVTGILLLTIDEKQYSYKFSDHIKIEVVLDKKVTSETNVSHLTEECEKPIHLEPEVRTRYSNEEENFVTDESFDLNPEFEMHYENSNNNLETVLAETSLMENEREEVNFEESKIFNFNLKARKRKSHVPMFVAKVPAKFKFNKADVTLAPLGKPTLKKSKLLGGKIVENLSLIESDDSQEDDIGENGAEKREVQGGEIVERVSLKKTPDTQSIQKKTKCQVRKLEMREDIWCSYCSTYFTCRLEFNEHVRVEPKKLCCEICHRILQFEADLLIHRHNKDTADDTSTSNVESCVKKLRTMKNLECHICGDTLPTYPHLRNHMLRHTGEYIYKCCVCGKLTRNHATLTKHKERHLLPTDKLNQIKCRKCKIVFNNRWELSVHRRSSPCASQCGLCGQTFADKTVRNFHYKTAHKNEILKCPECERLYSCEKSLEQHLKYHQTRQKTQCTICGIVVFHIRKHMVSRHGATLKRRSDTAEGTIFACDRCPKQFRKRSAFMRHVDTHLEEKRYQCNICTAQFATSGGLSRHFNVVHLKDPSYACDVCDKYFSERRNLRDHVMRIHGKSIPLRCSHCGLSFSQEEDLQKHIDAINSGEVADHEYSTQVFSSDQITLCLTST